MLQPALPKSGCSECSLPAPGHLHLCPLGSETGSRAGTLCRVDKHDGMALEPARPGFWPLSAIQQLGDLGPVVGFDSSLQQIAVYWMSAAAE